MKRQIPKQIYPILFLIDTLNGHMGSSEVKNDDFLNVPDEPCIWTFTIMRDPFWNSSYAFEFLHWEGIRTEIFILTFWPSICEYRESWPENSNRDSTRSEIMFNKIAKNGIEITFPDYQNAGIFSLKGDLGFFKSFL